MRSEPHDRRTPEYEERQSKLRFRDWRFRVADILGAVRAIERYTEHMSFEEFSADARTIDAVVRNLMTIGESTRWIPEQIRDAHHEVPWRTLRGVRNVVAHEYFGVDSEILWETVRTDLPPLAPTLEAILNS